MPFRWRRKNSALRCSLSAAAKLNCARTGLLAWLLGRDRDCKACTALRTAALEYLASARRGHPRQESMGSYASAVMRLVGPFHCSGSASLGFEFRPARSVNRSGIFLSGAISSVFQVDNNFERPRTRNRTIPQAIEQGGPATWGKTSRSEEIRI